MKKLIPALCLLLVSAVLMGTSTFAWFSMNNKVTVTGMEVRTKVSNNLFVAATTIDATAHKADADFGPAYNFTTEAALLEPVSSIDGLNFWYTDSATNVAANGSAKTATYTALNTGKADPTSDQLTAFKNANGADGSKGYQDFVFELKAVNAGTTALDLKLTKLDLAYKGVSTAEKAFRAAVFTQKFDTAYTMVSSATLPAATSIFSPADADTFTTGNKAVNAANTVSAVLTPNAAVSLTVAANTTEYYKVVVRIWLEGEDTTCNNDTFASLDKNWVLDLNFELGSGTAVTNLGQAEIEATATGVTLTTGDKLSNGETASTYAWYNALTGAAVGVTTAAAPAADADEDMKYYCVVTTTLGNTYVTNVITVAKSGS